MVTYGNAPEINALYDNQSRYSFDVNHSVHTKRTAAELLVTSDGLALPFALDCRRMA